VEVEMKEEKAGIKLEDVMFVDVAEKWIRRKLK
jgi:hypothetical protein